MLRASAEMKNPLRGYQGVNGDITGILPYAENWRKEKWTQKKKLKKKLKKKKLLLKKSKTIGTCTSASVKEGLSNDR
jgi:hypothetical protein